MLHEGGVQHAKRNPNRTAFKFRDVELSYLDLDRKSNGLASTLLQYGAQPGDRVGICSPTSQYLPIAVAGIHKAGCAFVPIDHSAPLSRILEIIKQASIDVMIVGDKGQALAEQLATQQPGLQLIVGCESNLAHCLTWNDIPATEVFQNNKTIQPSDLAYIIFTSGSTGEPKGIAHTHASGYAYVQRSIHTYSVHENDVIANFAPLYFDISTFAYFCGPSAGATTVLVPDEFALFPTNVAALVESEGVTIWYSAPLALQRLLTHSDFQKRDFSSLRWIKFGGEVMPVKYLAELMQHIPSARFSNVYGPAEVNQCTFYHLPGIPAPDQTVPIGSTWANTHALVLDPQDKPIKQTAGQLAISSPTMMLGYWGNAELTQLALHETVDSNGNKRTYYKTGDLVEYNSAGQLVFVGRSDRQVKVRGYRVELDDVEFHAMNLAGVIECAALLDTSDDNKNHILLIAQCTHTTTASEIKQYLASLLPRYACPHVVEVSTHPLPRNASGKIDRLALLTTR